MHCLAAGRRRMIGGETLRRHPDRPEDRPVRRRPTSSSRGRRFAGALPGRTGGRQASGHGPEFHQRYLHRQRADRPQRHPGSRIGPSRRQRARSSMKSRPAREIQAGMIRPDTGSNPASARCAPRDRAGPSWPKSIADSLPDLFLRRLLVQEDDIGLRLVGLLDQLVELAIGVRAARRITHICQIFVVILGELRRWPFAWRFRHCPSGPLPWPCFGRC